VKTRFTDRIQVCGPPGTNRALDELADRQHRTKAEVTRQAILHALAIAGIALDQANRERAA
jgi:predicted transcriptional regulator